MPTAPVPWTDTLSASENDRANVVIGFAEEEILSLPSPPAMPMLCDIASAELSATDLPSANPFMAPVNPTLTAVACASEKERMLIAPSLLMMSSSAPPSIPVATAREVELKSLKAAPSTVPAKVKLKPTATATASVVARVLADIDPRLVISSAPSPPSIPVAVASAVVVALLTASPPA